MDFQVPPVLLFLVAQNHLFLPRSRKQKSLNLIEIQGFA